MAVERLLVELIRVHKKSTASELMKEQQKRTGRPVVPFLPNTFRSETLQDFFLLQLDRLQLTAVCCNRRGV